jgi:hypothetical protein
MAAIFQDIDGSFMEWGTEKPLPGALAELSRFYAAGHQIIFTTQREENDPSFDMETLRSFIKTHFPTAIILYAITSPRIVFNDAGAIAINHPKDSNWNYDLLEMLEDEKKG